MNTFKIALFAAVVFFAFSIGVSSNISFQSQVLPIFNHSCVDCHSTAGEATVKTGLRLDSYANLMQGTLDGPVIVPGSSASSTLYLAISQQVDPAIQMPKHHDDALNGDTDNSLTLNELYVVRDWIEQGARNN